MRIKKISEYFERLSERTDSKKLKNKLDIENEEAQDYLLEVPVVGGIMYIIKMFFMGMEKMKKIKDKQNEGNKVKVQIKEVTSIKKSLRVQLNKFAEEGTIREINMDKENLAIFYEILKEFPSVTATPLGDDDSDFLLINKSEVEI